ncbi:MAG: hypothetical protein ACRD09_08820 [Vicinamibacterales bacterium]
MVAVPPAAQPRTLEDVLTAAAAYVGQYEAELGAMIAEERYDQKVVSPRRRDVRRRLDSHFLFLRVPGTNEWLGFRDVYAVNGRPVRAREDRLAALLIDPTADVAARAKAIVGESSRYNLGRQDHTVNVPPLVLDWITDSVRPRLVFSKRGEERISGVQAWRIGFKEISRPTLVRTPQGGDVLSEGTYWIEPGTGRVLETELVSHVEIGPGAGALEDVLAAATGRYKVRTVRSLVRVSYRPDSRLSVLVPVEMREKLEVPPYGAAEGTAKYSNFRRFEATARIK